MILFRLSCRIWSLVIQLIKFSFSFIYIVPTKALAWGGISDSAGSAIQQTAQGMGDKTMADLKQATGTAQRQVVQPTMAKGQQRGEGQAQAAGWLGKGQSVEGKRAHVEGMQAQLAGMSPQEKNSSLGKNLTADLNKGQFELSMAEQSVGEHQAGAVTGNVPKFNYASQGGGGGGAPARQGPAPRPSCGPTGGAAPAAAPAAEPAAPAPQQARHHGFVGMSNSTVGQLESAAHSLTQEGNPTGGKAGVLSHNTGSGGGGSGGNDVSGPRLAGGAVFSPGGAATMPGATQPGDLGHSGKN